METLEIGRRIRLARQAAGMTQEDLGRRLGYSQVQVSTYERGDVSGVSIEMLSAIARITQHPLTFFIEDAQRARVTLAEVVRERYPWLQAEPLREIDDFVAWVAYREHNKNRSDDSAAPGEMSRSDRQDSSEGEQ